MRPQSALTPSELPLKGLERVGVGVGVGWKRGCMLTRTFKELVSPHQREFSTTMREVKVQLRVGLGWKRVGEITHNFNYTSQRVKEPRWMTGQEMWKNGDILNQ